MTEDLTRKFAFELVELLKTGEVSVKEVIEASQKSCLLYTSPSPRDVEESRMPSSA